MVEAAVVTGLGKIADYLVAPIGRQFTYLFCFNSNIKELEAKFEEFQATRQGVQMGVDRAERNVRVIAPNVEAWLKSASEITTEVEGIIQDKAKVKEGCLNGWCPNLKLRYSLSRKAVKKTTVVVDLRKDGVQYTQLSYSPPPPCLETITNRDFTGFESRRLNMEEIFAALKHDEINLIGVCGMGGVGKTTMVNEVAKRAREVYPVEEVEVAMALVGQEPNLTNVQDCIAEMLGLKELRENKSPIVRADLLRKRLVQNNKKVLVILDDIWKEFDLRAMGIPLEGDNKNFKMLYTSRTRDLWHDVRTKKEIPLELLSEDEAWQLFREKAGDSADARDLQPIAKQIVHECGHLPLALVLIGSALSKKSGRNAIKNIWEGMLDRLTCASSTPVVDNQLSSRLQLSYEYLEDKEAQRLFLLCCFFQEDEDIRIEDLARYGYGLSLFDGISEMAKVRRRVFLIVDDLKSRYLLLPSSEEECVKVHDVVRDMGISIASKDECAIVSHGAVSEWPKTVTHEHYTAISVISEKIEELPEGLAYPNLKFLMLRCPELEELPPNFFKGMGKLKVLELKNFNGILSFQPLKNLTTLALEGFCDELDNVRGIGDLLNLEILSFRDSEIEELPEEIGGLVNLRLLDLSDTDSLNRIPPGVISRLVRLEELYCRGRGSKFSDWEGEGEEQGGRNANLREFGSLSNLNTLQIQIRKDVLIPESPIFSKLKNYRVAIVDQDGDMGFDMDDIDSVMDDVDVDFKGLKRFLMGRASIPVIDLLARSSDGLLLNGSEECNDLLREVLFRDGVAGIQQLKFLVVEGYDNLKCLADTMNRVHLPTAILRSEEKNPTTTAPPTAAFPILQILALGELPNLREICRGPVPTGSFGELTAIEVKDCGRLGNLFQLPVEGCLAQLKRLYIESNDMMEEVFQKERQGDVPDITNRIVFPKLEFLGLEKLPSLVGFCRGIDVIDFPQLKEVRLRYMPQFNLLFHNNSNLSSNSEQGFLSLFPHKVAIPSLEYLRLSGLKNVRNMFHPFMAGGLVNLQKLFINDCSTLEVVVRKEEEVGGHDITNRIVFPKLEFLELVKLPSLVGFCRGIDVIEFPQLKELRLKDMPQLNLLFHSNSNLSSNSEQGFLSLFPHKVAIPSLEDLQLTGLKNVRNMFHPSMAGGLVNLQKLFISNCSTLEVVVGKEEEVGGHGRKLDKTLFPQLIELHLGSLPKLKRFCHFTHPLELPRLSKMYIWDCPSMDAFSLGHVSAPNLSLPGISWNGDLNNAIKSLQKERKKEEEVDEEVGGSEKHEATEL